MGNVCAGAIRGLICLAGGLLLSAGSLQAQYKTKTDVLKGERWWGVFMTGEQMMPLEAPFPEIDLSSWVKSNTTPFLVSSRGRYIWSQAPFRIEYTGTSFLIDSPVEEVEAKTGGKTLREAYLVCCHRNFPPTEGVMPSPQFFTAPVYDMATEVPFGATADQIRSYAARLIESGYPAGTLIVPPGWQSTIGSFTPDATLYGDVAALADELHTKGFRLLFSVTPFVSGDGPIFRTYRDSGAFVRMSDGRVAIAEWLGGYSAFYDVTCEEVYDIIHKRLETLRDSCRIDGFVFDCEGALPYIRFSRDGAAEYLNKWSELGRGIDYSLYTISRGSGFTPYVHSLQMENRLDWDFLSHAIANLMTANLLGYPYSTVCIDPVRADSTACDPKLLSRYMQLASVLPVAMVDVAPWRYRRCRIGRTMQGGIRRTGEAGGLLRATGTRDVPHGRTAGPSHGVRVSPQRVRRLRRPVYDRFALSGGSSSGTGRQPDGTFSPGSVGRTLRRAVQGTSRDDGLVA